MEIILSILFIVIIVVCFKVQDGRVDNHCNTYNVDWKKVNNDRIVSDLSDLQVNKNIINGKYDKRN